ncbi:MAG: ybaB [Lacunisphaera sp.]|nr:ybaB [Lacunisphaera sp.]MDB6165831.1 ybaB [Lacunisphaera sp.]
MAGVGKLLKQAQKMQKQIETMQSSLETQVIDVSSGGGAVQIKVNCAGKFLALTLDPEFLKEDKKLVEETILHAVQEAAAKAKERNEAEMQKISAAFQMPGMF